MTIFFNFVLKHKKVVLIITALALAVSIISMLNTKLNSDLSVYLPDDSTTKETVAFLTENFGINGDAVVCIQAELDDYDKMTELCEKLSAVDKVRSILWLGTYDHLFDIGLNGEIKSNISLIPNGNISKLTENCFKTVNGKGYYIFTVSLSVHNSDTAAAQAMENFASILQSFSEENGDLDYHLGGSAMQSKNMLESALGDVPKFLFTVVIIFALILFFTSSSFMSAIIFLITIAISIILNMGTNFSADGISTVTFSVAAILQLALSMDYSIFLTHAYERALKKGDTNALLTALKRTTSVVFASVMTTAAGFCALFFMKYKLGFDLGLCLAKGVFLSFLTVLTVQPCLMSLFQKVCDKTTHKALSPKFEKLAQFPSKLKYFSIALVIVLLVPSIFITGRLEYYYLDSGFDEDALGAKKVCESNGSRSVYVVPFDSYEKQKQFNDELLLLQADGKISGVTGFYALANYLLYDLKLPYISDQTDFEDMSISVVEMLKTISSGAITNELQAKIDKALEYAKNQYLSSREQELGRPLTDLEKKQALTLFNTIADSTIESYRSEITDFSAMFKTVQDSFTSDIDNTKYTYIAVMISGAGESAEAISTSQEIQNIISRTFPNTAYRCAGNTQVVRDLKSTTTKDFTLVSIVSALLILLIIVFTFKKISLSLLTVATIELAILINLAITVLMGSSINFMTYVVITAIQLGATIDYAILLVKNYIFEKENREDKTVAISSAIKNSAFSILISVSILFSACLSVYIISGDKIIREITLMIARGSVISAMLVLIVLPALLSLSKKKK